MKRTLLSMAVAAAMTGCYPSPSNDKNQVLICTIDGRVTYRSKPSSFWIMDSNSGGWHSQGWKYKYSKSAFESCYTEEVQ